MKSAHKTKAEKAAKTAADKTDDAGATEVEKEEVRTGEPPQVTGQRLIALIRKRLAERRMSEREIADVIGVTSIYWTSLTNGHRRLSGLPHAKMQRLAEFLEIPVIHAYMLADLYKPSDLVVTKKLDDDLQASLAKMRLDKRWSFLVPDDETLALTPQASRLAIVMLYEHVAGQALLKRAFWDAGVGPDERDPNSVLTV